MKQIIRTLNLLMILAVLPISAVAGPDQFVCDSAIYSGGSSSVTPNIMFIINNSKNMADQSAGTEPYSKLVDYPGSFKKNGIYFRNNPSSPWQLKVDTVGGTATGAIKVTCGGTAITGAKELLLENGFWTGGLDDAGLCSNKNNDQKDFYFGNLINKLENTPVPQTWSPNTEYALGTLITPTTSNGFTYRATFNLISKTSGASEPIWPTTPGSVVVDSGIKWERVSDLFEVTKVVVQQVVSSLRTRLKVGVMTFGHNNDGGYIRAKVDSVYPDGATGDDQFKRISALLNTGTAATAYTLSTGGSVTVNSLVPISSNTSEPVAAPLFDASLYFRGQSDSTTRIGTEVGGLTAYPSPIQWKCQKNFIVLLTTGATDLLPIVASKIGDHDDNNVEGEVADAAKLLKNFDHNSTLVGTQGVQTSIVQFLTKDAKLEKATTVPYGNGTYVLANSTEQLEAALRNIVLNLVREADTAFVAPVVPASPENRTFSGKRIYLGFFKPISQKPWLGNLKKFGLDKDNNIASSTKDADGLPLPATDSSGAFLETARSYWSSADDAGSVILGGIGEQLLTRTDARNIYTYLGTSDLTDSSNAFNTTNINSAILGLDATTNADSGLTSADSGDLVNFVRGIDSFDDDGDSDITEKRDWMLGDILHSRPLVLNYANYSFNETNEADCSVNKTYVIVGANDGTLHAIRDCDGSEAWAFVPPDLLNDLQYLRGKIHNYYVDGSATYYINDRNGDGTIDPDNDLVILFFGTYRGGGSDQLQPVVTSPKSGEIGAYYALNITNPEVPQWMGKITNLTPDVNGAFPFAEMGETWGMPRLAKIKTDSTTQKVVAIFGGGYDTNEDMRWGNTQLFPDGLVSSVELPSLVNDFREGSSFQETVLDTTPVGPLGSAKNLTAPQANPKGRALYVVEIAEIVASINDEGKNILTPNTDNLGSKVWSFGYGETASNSESPNMTFSMPSDVALVDSDTDGFTDRLYAGDMGGQLWRFDIGYKFGVRDTDDDWTGQRIFSAQVTGDSGRKIFHRPDVVPLDRNTMLVYFGTGDRAHPLNYLNPATDGGAVVDRFYMVRDTDLAYDTSLSGYNNSGNRPTLIDESHLVDLTTNPLQRDDLTTAQWLDYKNQLYNYSYNEEMNPLPRYGWYVKLNYPGGSDATAKRWGEKALATPIVLDKKVFFTTYQPLPYDSTVDPCDAGNLGKARIYALDYRTAEAVYDWEDGTLDVFGESQISATNERAGTGGEVLRRADREYSLGGGIPTTPTIIINENGELDLVTPADQNFVKIDLGATNMIRPVYWLQW